MNIFDCIWPARFTYSNRSLTKKPRKVSGALEDIVVIPSNLNFRPAKCLIVGGGPCGLWFAMHLKKMCPHFTIDILETAPIVYPQTHLVDLDPNEISTFLEWTPSVAKTNSIRMDDLRLQMEQYILRTYNDIKILPTSYEIRIAEVSIPYTYVFGIDGSNSSFYNTYFKSSNDTTPAYQYFIELSYHVSGNPSLLTPLQLAFVKKNIAEMRDIQQLVYENIVVLRLEISSGQYLTTKDACKTFHTSAAWTKYNAIPKVVRDMLHFWISARKYFLKETVQATSPEIRFFQFPTFVRNPVTEKHPTFYLLGAAAFQLDLSNGLQQSMNFCASIAALFCTSDAIVRDEFVRRYRRFVEQCENENNQICANVNISVPVYEIERWRETAIY
jgi:hypothetical protein